MDRISAWLCPTEQHRLRAREAGARVRSARTVAAAACGVALFAVVPFQGWWILLLLAATAVILATFEMRLRRSRRPELVAIQSMFFILALISVGVAFSGGADSPALPWLILPVTIAAARFRPQVLVVGAALTATLMFGLSVGVDAQALVDDPTRLISALTLLVGLTAIASALTEGEIEHRDRAVLDPLTGLLNRSSLESRAVEIEQQARLSGAPVSLVLLDLDRFKRRERHARTRARGHRAARRGVRDPQVPAPLRAGLPHRGRGVPRACSRAWRCPRPLRWPSACATRSRTRVPVIST